MKQRRNKTKISWFGKSLIASIIIVGLGAALLFFNVFDLNLSMFFGEDPISSETDEEQDEFASKKTLEQVEKIQETVGKKHEDIGKFVSDIHNFYNETTGYGRIDSLNWEQQKKKAKEIANELQEKAAKIENKSLERDIEEILNLTKDIQDKKETSVVRALHRMFHDLDIALNSYNESDKIWGVTETLQTKTE